jgi:hypothetical protein
MYEVFFEEDMIMRVQQLDLIYSQSGLFYKIFPDDPRSILEKTRQRLGPDVDGIIGSTQTKPAYPFSNQLQQLSIQQTMASQTTSSVAPPTQKSDVHSMKMTPNSLIERRNNEKRVRGIRNSPIMLAEVTLKRRIQSIIVIFARKTKQPINILGL